MNYYVYILSNTTGTTIYVGVTRNLLRRVFEHKNKLDPSGFTAKYDIHKLVYYETPVMCVRHWNAKNKSKVGTARGRIDWLKA